MKQVHFFDPATGIIQPIPIQISSEDVDEIVRANTPPGLTPIFGVADALAQKVDPATGQLVDYQPPAPEPVYDYEWNADSRRWYVRASVAERRVRVNNAQAEIDRLESVQLRSIREAYLNPQDDEARRRVAAIDTAIAEQRAIIRANS